MPKIVFISIPAPNAGAGSAPGSAGATASVGTAGSLGAPNTGAGSALGIAPVAPRIASISIGVVGLAEGYAVGYEVGMTEHAVAPTAPAVQKPAMHESHSSYTPAFWYFPDWHVVQESAL
jgi:hypothetical protein